MNHEMLERNVLRLGIGIAIVISFGGLAQIVPLMYQAQVVEPLPGQKPYTALELAGRDIYIREGCYNCHSQMIRSLRAEVARYGRHSLAAESVYDHPFQWGSKRTGPDLARVGGRYSDEWHRVHLINPRDVVPESNMPAYPWLLKSVIDWKQIETNMKAMRLLGVPYTDADIESAAQTATYSEMQALIAYLQGLGRWLPRESLANPQTIASAAVPVSEPAAAQPAPETVAEGGEADTAADAAQVDAAGQATGQDDEGTPATEDAPAGAEQ
jgi:cytochrome c oxidase cbb3-type subunit 2